MNDLYQEILLEEARHPQNFGSLEDADVVLKARNASCGDDLTVYLKLSADQHQIVDLAWEGHGCIISQAAMSVLSVKIKEEHLSLSEIEQLPKSALEELLGIEEISPGRLKCLLLGKQALSDITQTQKTI